MSAGFTLTHLEACSPRYKQTPQLRFTAGFTKDQQDAHHLQLSLFFFSSQNCMLLTCYLLWWSFYSFSFYLASKNKQSSPLCRVGIGVTGARNRRLFLESDWRLTEELTKPLLWCWVTPAHCERAEDILPITGDVVGTVLTEILLTSVSLPLGLTTFYF